MFVFGFLDNIKGVTYPLIKSEFSISYEQQGVMVSILSLGYVLFCIVGGILIGSCGVKKTFLLGFVFMALGLVAVFFMNGFLFIAGSLFVIAAAFGLFEVSTNALATQIFTSKAALLMNLMHFFYGAGSSLSPLAAGFIAAAFSWRNAYFFSVSMVLLFFLPSLFTRFPQEQKTDREKAKKTSFFTALKTPMVWVFSVVLGLMVGVELCSSNWAGLYFQDVFNLDPKTTGAAFISGFYILFTISRLLSGFAIEKLGYLRSLFIAAFASVFILALGFALGPKGIYVLPALGFFSAIFWPTVLAVAMVYFKEDAPVMTSAIIVIAGAINGGIQFLMGLTNRLAGPAWGYRSAVLYALLAAASLLVLRRRLRRPAAICTLLCCLVFGCAKSGSEIIPPEETSANTVIADDSLKPDEGEGLIAAHIAEAVEAPSARRVSAGGVSALSLLSPDALNKGVYAAELNPSNYQKINKEAMEGMGMAPFYTAYLSGQKFYRDGEYENAIAEFTQSISLNGNYANAYASRGNAQRRKGDYARAIEDYSRALGLEGDYAEVYNYRGFVYAQRKDFRRAIADYTQAIRYRADYADAYFNRACAQNELKNYDAAISDFTQVINLEPLNWIAYNQRGKAWYGKGDRERAAADYETAEKLKPAP